MLVSEASAAAFLLTRFHGMSREPEKQARMPNSARVLGVAQYPSLT